MTEKPDLSALVDQHLANGGAITKLDYAGNVVGKQVAQPAPVDEVKEPIAASEAPEPDAEPELVQEEPHYAHQASRALRKIRSVVELLNSVLDDFPR